MTDQTKPLSFGQTQAFSAATDRLLARSVSEQSAHGSARQRRPTMNDVARVAGVGVKTVSRVVNREGGVRNELVLRVEKAISQLGYRHNAGASSLRRSDQSTATVGLVVEDIGNPFSSLLQRAVEDACRDRELLLLVSSSDRLAKREYEAVEALSNRRVDGLIIMPSGKDHEYLASEISRGTPVVFVDRTSPELLTADTVVADNEGGAFAGTLHLISHGHTRIAHLGDLTRIETAERRYTGYLRALTNAGLTNDPALVRRDLDSLQLAMAATRELLALSNPPTAIFSGQNIISIGVIRVLRELGLHRKIALVGFDDFLLADLLEPAITVVAQDPLVIGSRAAEVLFRRIDGFTGPTEHVMIGTTLIPRGSGEILP
jgi:LacI family transcriptional regulator